MRRNGKIGAVAALALVLALGSGCDPLVQLNIDKADNGLVVVLPVIWLSGSSTIKPSIPAPRSI